MTRKITCIECPTGCVLVVDAEQGKVLSVEGAGCPKGEKYAADEIGDPRRVLTSTVAAKGLACRMVPVRTESPFPKGSIIPAMKEIRKVLVTAPVKAGDILITDLLGSGVDVIATREVPAA